MFKIWQLTWLYFIDLESRLPPVGTPLDCFLVRQVKKPRAVIVESVVTTVKKEQKQEKELKTEKSRLYEKKSKFS